MGRNEIIHSKKKVPAKGDTKEKSMLSATQHFVFSLIIVSE